MSNRNGNKNVVVVKSLNLGEGWEVRQLGDQDRPCYFIYDRDFNGKYYYLDKNVLMINGKEVETKASTGLDVVVLEEKIKKQDIAGINKDFVKNIKKDVLKRQKKSRTTELKDGWKLVERVSKNTGEKCIAIINANGNGRAFYENGEEADVTVNKIGERKKTNLLISGYDHIADLLAEKNIKAIVDEFAPQKKKSVFGNLFSKKPLRNIDNNEDVSMGTHSAESRNSSLGSM